MAIDPKLISVKTASELPIAVPSSAGQFFFFEGNQMKKSPMTDIYDRVISGIKGIATQTNAPTPYSASTYPDGLFERYIVPAPLTSPNSWGNIVVTQAELDVNFVYFNVTNGVVVKELSAKPKGIDGKTIEDWSAIAYVSGSNVFYDDKIYTNTADALSTDVPGVASVWVVKIKGEDEKTQNVLNLFSDFQPETEITTFKSGFYDLNGNFNANSNARAYKFGARNFIKISGGLVGTTAEPFVVVLGRNGSSFSPLLIGTGEIVTDRVVETNGYEEIMVNFLITDRPVPTVFTSATVKEYIDGMTYADDKFKKVLSVENIFLKAVDLVRDEGFYIDENGVRLSFEGVVNKHIEVKKGDAVSFRGKKLIGQYGYVIKATDGTIIKGGLHEYYSAEFNILKDGTLFFNQSITDEGIETFTIIRKKKTFTNSFEKFIEAQSGKLINGTKITLPTTMVHGGYFDVKNSVIGVTNFNDHIEHADYAVSPLYPVLKGETILVTGFFGNNGVALFGNNGKLTHKLFLSTDVQYTDLSIVIPENGFVNYSYKKSEPFAFKIYNQTFMEGTGSESSGLILTIEKYAHVERPKFGRIDLRGVLPTDDSPTRVPTTLDFDFSINNEKKLTAKVKLSIQGSGSALYPKKGYTFDVLNFENAKAKIKFGDLIATDSFHLKAYQSDRTHTRDVGMGRVWRDMIYQNPYPVSKVNNIPFVLNPTAEDSKYISDAKYHPDGFPNEVYINGTFLGLFTMRLKKTRENYALNNTIKEHIFLDNGDYNAFFTTGFDYTKWEIKSPKMTGYIDMGPVSDATVLGYINRFFNWAKDFKNNTGTARANASDYIVIKNWIDYKIFCEVFFHHDSVGNNVNLITWNGNQWSFCPYDMDFTIGMWHLPAWELQTTRTGFINGDIWDSFRSYFNTEIRERYTKLRNSGFLTVSVLGKYFDDIAQDIPRRVYEADSKLWASLFTNGEPTQEHIKLFLHNRLTWLDSQWLNV